MMIRIKIKDKIYQELNKLKIMLGEIKMEYISADEFLKQPIEVQKVFLDWWKPSIGDLYQPRKYPNKMKMVQYISLIIDEVVNLNKENYENFKEQYIPLLTEGQLRKFIEDKTGCKNVEILSDIEIEEYYCDLYKTLSSGIEYKHFTRLGNDKFQAYWKVALEITKEEVE
jgi:hypothetical protein